MTASASTRAHAVPAGTLTDALRDRNIWLLGALGLATGVPAGWTWYALLAWNGYDQAEQTLWLAMTAFGLIGLVELLAAPFLDRYASPLFRGLGRRRSWVASALAAALVLVAIYAVAAALSEGLAIGLGVVLGILALPVMALLWISLDALRIELLPGRTQAVALAAQYVGALAAAAMAARFETGPSAATALALALLLALGLAAALYIAEPDPVPYAPAGLLATLTRPWSAFFTRHGKAAALLLAAVAFYALGAGIADYLGKQGYVVDIVGPGRAETDTDAIGATRRAMAPLEIVFTLIGALAGMLVAFRLAPARAFVVLQYIVLALAGFFLVCKLALGFTVITVGLLFAARSLILGAALVIYGAVAARLTARPHTAGQFALLGLFVGLFWISEAGMNRIAPVTGSFATVGAACVAAVAAILLIQAAGRTARRAGN